MLQSLSIATTGVNKFEILEVKNLRTKHLERRNICRKNNDTTTQQDRKKEELAQDR